MRFPIFLFSVAIVVALKSQARGTKAPQVDSVYTEGLPSVTLDKVSITGIFNFVSYYRSIPTGYPGLASPYKNIEFTPYPAGGNFGGNFYRQPLLNLMISGSPSKNTSFDMEYALSHFYTGLTADSTRKLSVQNLLQIHGYIDTRYGNLHLTAGGGALNYSISPLTLYNKSFREPMFEKLPWDWYTNSFEKYKDQYNASSIASPPFTSYNITQGFLVQATELPLNLYASIFYGRTSFTLSPDRVAKGYPSQLLAGTLGYGRDTTGRLSVNCYNQFGYINEVSDQKDLKQIATMEYALSTSIMKINAELGMGRVVNPKSEGSYGEAIMINYSLLNPGIQMPVQLMVYSIDKGVASMESAVLNANPTVTQGGYNGYRNYDNVYYPSYLQEVSMAANNRRGVVLKADKTFERFKIDVGNAVSAEKENLANSVSFPLLVNAFSRSRFQPWVQHTGPYQMLNNRYRRSFQTLQVTDTSSYEKCYNASDVSVKYYGKLLQRDVIIDFYTYLGSVGKRMSLYPQLSRNSFVYTRYHECSLYYSLTDKLTLIGFAAVQTAQGNMQTQLDEITKLPSQQKGHGFGFGFDYDFTANAGLFIRHRWMAHRDKSFFRDHFKGQESTLEIKIFF